MENGTQGCSYTSSSNTEERKAISRQTVPEKWQYCLLPLYHLDNFHSTNNKDLPIRIAEYNFSEAQAGKDLCDSKTGCSRLHIFKYADEGHDILNCTEIKTALESHGGVKGTRACIVSVDQQMEPKIKTKIQGISSLNNFVFSDDGITVQRAYTISDGKKIAVADKDIGLEKVTVLKVIFVCI